MKAVFIADAHLQQPADANYRALLDFLDRQTDGLDALFLLGDIFEFWIGYRHAVFSAHLPLLARLQTLATTGCRLFYVEGNHDFNLAPFFNNNLDCTVIADARIIDFDGRKIFICHGDLADPANMSYRLMRRFWRSRLLRLIAAGVPADQAWRCGNSLCTLSRRHKQPAKDPSALVLPYAAQCLQQGADSFVCGHFHFPLQTQSDSHPVFVLGDWMSRFSYLQLTDGRFQLGRFNPGARNPFGLAPPAPAT
jgi:UDP-2,3-diacylglucosamine hydrolase